MVTCMYRLNCGSNDICCHDAGKQNIQICISGSALRPSKSAVRKEHLGGTATVSAFATERRFCFSFVSRNEFI